MPTIEFDISVNIDSIVSAITPPSRPHNGESWLFMTFEKNKFKNVSAKIQKSLLISNKTTN